MDSFGKSTNEMAKRDVTQTPEFKRWFGNSKVVDKDGNPLVMYHGTPAPVFNKFGHVDNHQGGGNWQSGPGFYFTTNPDSASGYSHRGRSQVGSVYPVYLSIQKPIEVPWSGGFNDIDIPLTRRQVEKIFKQSPNIKDPDGAISNFGDVRHEGFAKVFAEMVSLYDNLSMMPAMVNDVFSGDIIATLKAVNKVLGYDGATTTTGGGDTHWIAWFPNQIKSVYNKGTFNPNSDNIDEAMNNFDKLIKVAYKVAKAYPQRWGDCHEINATVAAWINDRLGQTRMYLLQTHAHLDLEVRDRGGYTDTPDHVIVSDGLEVAKSGEDFWANIDPDSKKIYDFSTAIEDQGAEVKYYAVYDLLSSRIMNKKLYTLLNKELLANTNEGLKDIAAAAILGVSALTGNVDAKTTTPAKQTASAVHIDINKIVKIESSGNPKAENKTTGARGLCQLMKPTWEEVVKKMHKDWSWDDAFDGDKNKAVGEYYTNTEIPRMLKHFHIEDSVPARLAAYNWGIGFLKREYEKGGDWQSRLPKETRDYIAKYKRLSESINESLNWKKTNKRTLKAEFGKYCIWIRPVFTYNYKFEGQYSLDICELWPDGKAWKQLEVVQNVGDLKTAKAKAEEKAKQLGFVSESVNDKISALKNKAKEYSTAQEFVKDFYRNDWSDEIAFGLKNGVQMIDPKRLNIIWRDDWKNAYPLKGDYDKMPPIDVTYRNGRLEVEDGHHRLKTAIQQGKDARINLEIHQSPLTGCGLEDDKDLFRIWNEANRINESKRDVTQLPEFKKWFGNSKVVDKDGSPIILYHGTPMPIYSKFNKKKQGGWGGALGFWFATTGHAASQFARNVYAGQGAGIYPVYLSIQNPIEFRGWEEFTRKVDSYRRSDITNRVKALKKEVLARGHDGVIIRNSDTDFGGVRDDYVVFKPNQIKSIYNKGTFSVNSNDIMESKAVDIVKIGIAGLSAEARKHSTFQDFEKAWLGEIRHGLYWHITYDKDFKVNSEKGPVDASSMAGSPRMSKGALMITSDLPMWAESYTDNEKTGGKTRKYAALIDISDVPNNECYQVKRGFGNEFYVKDASKVKVIGTYPISTALQLDATWDRYKPQSFKELKNFYDEIHQTKESEEVMEAVNEKMSAKNYEFFRKQLATPEILPCYFDVTIYGWLARIALWGDVELSYRNTTDQKKLKTVTKQQMIAKIYSKTGLRVFGKWEIEKLGFSKVKFYRYFLDTNGKKASEEFIINVKIKNRK